MKAVIRILALTALLLAVPAWGATMPWTTFSQMAKEGEVIGAQLGICATREGPRETGAQLVRDPKTGDVWGLWYSVDTGRLVVAYFPKGVDIPTEVGIGTVTAGQTDVIPALTWTPHQDDRSGPCEALYPTRT